MQETTIRLSGALPRIADAIPRQPDTDTVWRTFEVSLGDALLLLEEDEFLIVESKRRQHYVQFAGEGHHGMRVEAISNAFIENPDDRLTEAQLSALACATLRHVYDIPHPGDLEYRAFRARGGEIRFPSLRLYRIEPLPREQTE